MVRSPFGTHCQSGEAEANTTDTGDSKEKLESEQVALASDKVTEEKEDSLTSYVGKKIGLVTYVMGWQESGKVHFGGQSDTQIATFEFLHLHNSI